MKRKLQISAQLSHTIFHLSTERRGYSGVLQDLTIARITVLNALQIVDDIHVKTTGKFPANAPKFPVTIGHLPPKAARHAEYNLASRGQGRRLRWFFPHTGLRTRPINRGRNCGGHVFPSAMTAWPPAQKELWL
jgi:hypothetical protein